MQQQSNMQNKFLIDADIGDDDVTLPNLPAVNVPIIDDAVNREVAGLKKSLTNYLLAVTNLHQSEKTKSLESFEKYYKNIQKLRKFITKDDNEVLNRYMVKIKTNVSFLESSMNKNIESNSMSSN